MPELNIPELFDEVIPILGVIAALSLASTNLVSLTKVNSFGKKAKLLVRLPQTSKYIFFLTICIICGVGALIIFGLFLWDLREHKISLEIILYFGSFLSILFFSVFMLICLRHNGIYSSGIVKGAGVISLEDLNEITKVDEKIRFILKSGAFDVYLSKIDIMKLLGVKEYRSLYHD